MRTSLIACALLAFALPSARADLVAFYDFDNPANPLEDSSPNGNDLTLVGGANDPTYGAASGFSGGGYDFNGANRLIAPIDINPAAMTSMTMGAWVRTDVLGIGAGTQQLHKVMGHDNGAWDRVLGLDTRTAAAGGPEVQHSFRYSAFTGTNNFGPIQNTQAPANTTDWTFLAVVYDGPNNLATIYIDLDASNSADALFSASSPTVMGTGQATMSIGSIRPDNANEGWDGGIDQAFIYDEALDESRLTEIRDGGRNAILGLGESDPDIVVSPRSLFGDLTSLGAGLGAVTQSVTISNLGDSENLNISNIAPAGPDAGNYSIAPPVPTVIAPGADADVDVIFTPPTEGGTFEATLEITSDDEDTPIATVSLNATVTSDPNIEVVYGNPLFGTITSNALPGSISRTITIRNTGVANALNLTIPLEVTGTNAADYSLVGPTSIAPGTEGELTVTLNPGGADGDFFASLEITSDDADTPSITVSLDASLFIVEPAELIAFYPFDDAAAPLTDVSGVTGDAVVGGGTPIYEAAGGFEGGYYQFGGSDRLTVALDINPTAIPQISLGAWVRTDSLASGLRKVMGHDNGAWDRTIGLDEREGGFRYTAFTGTNNNGPVAGTPVPVSTDDWTFLAVTYDDIRAEVSVFVDLDASTTDDAIVKVSEPTVMGPGNTAMSIGSIRPDVPNEGWVGCIDNAFIFDGILTDDEVADLRNRGKAAFLGPDNFRITSILRNPDNTVTLTWNSNPNAGTDYTVRFNTNLTAPYNEWPDDSDGVPTGGETTTYTTVTEFTQARMFFVIQQN